MDKRLNELDGLRGLAALTVFIGHGIGMLMVSGFLFELFNSTILHVFWDGYAAVIFFFVLSGFVLALPFFNNNQKKINYKAFLIKRIFRLYPVFILIILLSLILKKYLFIQESFKEFSPWINSFWLGTVTIKDLINHLILIGPGYDTGLIDPVIWSLKIEMRMSLIFPLIIILLRYSKTYQTSLLILSIAIITGLLINVDTLLFLPMFIMGGLMAKYKNSLSQFFLNLSAFKKLIIFIISLFLYTCMFSLPGIGKTDPMIGNTIIAIGSCTIILLSLNSKKASKFLNTKSVKFLGDVSYSFYLIHFPILLSCTTLLLKFHLSIVLCWLISLLFSLFISHYCYKYVEITFQHIGRKIAKKVQSKLIVFSKQHKADV